MAAVSKIANLLIHFRNPFRCRLKLVGDPCTCFSNSWKDKRSSLIARPCLEVDEAILILVNHRQEFVNFSLGH